MGELIRGVVKLVIVIATLAGVAVGLYFGYRLVFRPTETVARLELPSFDLNTCSAPGRSPDPVDLAYSYQIQEYQDLLKTPASSDSHEVHFNVTEGELAADIAARLQKEGFIRNKDAFVLLVKCRHASEGIQAGDHVLRRNMTMDEIVAALQKGNLRGINVTITPGWRAEQIADYLATVGLPQYNKDEFLRLVKAGKYDYDFLKNRPPTAAQSVEGYLLPETYNVLQGITSDQLINRFLYEFDQQVTPEMRQQAAAEKLSLHDAITLASIIEREAVRKEEAPIIASVYINRIRAKMLLNADPTVQYAIGYQPETKQWWPVVPIQLYQKVDSPYNTYIYPGLPPGPICEPSLNSIRAALQPKDTGYFYFLAKGDGSHVFANTLEEQKANLAKYGYAPLPTPKP